MWKATYEGCGGISKRTRVLGKPEGSTHTVGWGGRRPLCRTAARGPRPTLPPRQTGASTAATTAPGSSSPSTLVWVLGPQKP